MYLTPLDYRKNGGGDKLQPEPSQLYNLEETQEIWVYGKKLQQGQMLQVTGQTTLGEFRRQVTNLANLEVAPFLLNTTAPINNFKTWEKHNLPQIKNCIGQLNRDDASERDILLPLITSNNLVYSLSITD